MKNIKTKDMMRCAIFTALIAIGAFIKIPIPVLPFTLQFLFTMMAGLLLGKKLGTYSVLMYVILGLIGIPIFTEGGGLGYIFKPTFGYILGFCIATYVTGSIANKVRIPSYKRILSVNFVGLFVVYAVGMIYYYIICNFVIQMPIGVRDLILYCFILAVPGDIALCLVGATLAYRLIPLLNAKVGEEERQYQI